MTEGTSGVNAPAPRSINEIRTRLVTHFGLKKLQLWPERGQNLKDTAVLDHALLDEVECGSVTHREIREDIGISREDLRRFLAHCRSVPPALVPQEEPVAPPRAAHQIPISIRTKAVED